MSSYWTLGSCQIVGQMYLVTCDRELSLENCNWPRGISLSDLEIVLTSWSFSILHKTTFASICSLGKPVRNNICFSQFMWSGHHSFFLKNAISFLNHIVLRHAFQIQVMTSFMSPSILGGSSSLWRGPSDKALRFVVAAFESRTRSFRRSSTTGTW